MAKTEIVNFGGSEGYHLKDIAKTSKRLVEGSSWKKQRIVMLIPAGAMMSTKVALSQRAMMFPPNQPLHIMGVIGEEVGIAFSNAIEEIIHHPDLSQWEFILTIEHDNVPEPDSLLKLLQSMEAHPEFACISGLYFTKGEGGVAQIWGDINDPLPNFRPQPPQLGKIIECYGTGMGFALWRISMFKDERIRRPIFKTVAGSEGIGTQDLYAWTDLHKWGYRCAVDCNIKIGHYDHINDILW